MTKLRILVLYLKRIKLVATSCLLFNLGISLHFSQDFRCTSVRTFIALLSGIGLHFHRLGLGFFDFINLKKFNYILFIYLFIYLLTKKSAKSTRLIIQSAINFVSKTFLALQLAFRCNFLDLTVPPTAPAPHPSLTHSEPPPTSAP